jgi:hypothetical protein
MDLKKQKVYKDVYVMACQRLLQSDIQERSLKAGTTCRRVGKGFEIEMPFFDEMMTVSVPDFLFRSNKGSNVTLVTKIVLLHYINTASGEPLGGERISYEDIPSLGHYLPVFEKRVLKPLTASFGYNSHAFLESGLLLGAAKDAYGSASFTIFALAKVPLTFVLWEGDEEFPPSARVLYDPSVPGYLPLEDIVVVSKLAATRILKKARSYAGSDTTYDL